MCDSNSLVVQGALSNRLDPIRFGNMNEDLERVLAEYHRLFVQLFQI